ncbi:MAG: MBL fold metallo-hydrolase [Promethearchaeota archaeon]
MVQGIIVTKQGKINDFIHLIDLHEFGMARVLACFIAEFDEDICILDCGSSLEVNRILRYLKKMNLSLSRVKYLITSHHHFDHTGGMWKLYNSVKKYNSNVKILTNEKTKMLLNDFEYHLSRAARTYGAFVGKMKQIENSAFKIIEPSNKFLNNPNSLEYIDEFNLNGEKIKLCILKTPGHTPDHQCPLFIKNNEIEFIYLGEAAGTIYHSTKLITMPTSMPIYFNYELFMKSLQNLKKLKTPLKIGYTHYGVISGKENIRYILQEQETFMREFKQKVIELYEEKPETQYVFKKLIPFFIERSDLNEGNSLALEKIVLGVVYGMLLNLGFRELPNSEREQITKYEDKN